MDFDVIKQNIGDFPLGETFWFEETDSTNDRLKESAVGTLAVAGKQSRGKGTRGRSFESEEGGLYFSFVSPPWEKINLMTPAAAVAVSETLEELTDLKTEIKWVNDVYAGGRKLCGILCERSKEGVVVGIGINIENDVPKELSGGATSVKIEGGKIPDKETLIAGIIRRFSAFGNDESHSFMSEYKRKNLVIGRKIEYVVSGEILSGVATDVTADGLLEVDGERLLSSGDVRIKLKNEIGDNI